MQLPCAKCDVPPDTVDDRDFTYSARPITVPAQLTVAPFRKAKVPVLDQGDSGASAGCAVATAANYLLRSRGLPADSTSVSPWMIHELARRFDDVAGRHSAQVGLRSALKAWRAFGACDLSLWPNLTKGRPPTITESQAQAASESRLGAYFRVDCRDLSAMHNALAEVGVLVASANIHEGWLRPSERSGAIVPSCQPIGGHAFVIVGYDADGFWIQNSWGKSWGKSGIAHILYDDWLSTAMDAWIPRMSAAIRLSSKRAMSALLDGSRTNDLAAEVRPHVVNIGVNGTLNSAGLFGNVAADLEQIFVTTIPRAIHSGVRRILLFCGGWQVDTAEYAHWIPSGIAEALEKEVYPVVLLWESGAGALLTEIVRKASARSATLTPQGIGGSAFSVRTDRTFEADIAAHSGSYLWSLAKSEADSASNNVAGGMRLVAGHLAHLIRTFPNVEISIAAVGTGSLLLAPFTALLAAGSKKPGSAGLARQSLRLRVAHGHMYEPACPMDLFLGTYCDALQYGGLLKLSLYVDRNGPRPLGDGSVASGASFLDVVSRVLEVESLGSPAKSSTPVAGFEQHVMRVERLKDLIKAGRLDLAQSSKVESSGATLESSSVGADPTRDSAAFSNALDGNVARAKRTGGMQEGFLHKSRKSATC